MVVCGIYGFIGLRDRCRRSTSSDLAGRVAVHTGSGSSPVLAGMGSYAGSSA